MSKPVSNHAFPVGGHQEWTDFPWTASWILSVMVSNARRTHSPLRRILSLADMAFVGVVVLGGCAGGDQARPQEGRSQPSSAFGRQAGESSATSDIDRILAENPRASNKEDLRSMREDVEKQEASVASARKEGVDAYQPHDRRLKKKHPEIRDELKLDGTVDKHDRFADEKAAQYRYEFSWAPVRMDPAGGRRGR
jgi:hypothetical protein